MAESPIDAQATCPPPPALASLSSAELGAAPRPYARLRALLALERRDLGGIVVYATAIGVLGLATPVAVQALLHSVAFTHLMQPVLVLTLLLSVGLSLSALLVGLQTLAVEMVSRRVFLRVLQDFATRLPRVRYDAPIGERAEERVDRFFDVVTIEKSTATLLFDGLASSLQIAAGLALLAVYHPLLLAFDVGLIVALAIVALVLGRGALASAVLESKRKYAAADWLQLVARHEPVFHTASGARWSVRTAEALGHAWLDARERHFRIVMRQFGALLVVQVGVSAGLLALGGALVIEGQLSLGQLVAAEIVLASTVVSLGKLGRMLGKLYDLLAAVDKIGSVLDLPCERSDGATLDASGPPLTLRVQGLRVFSAAGVLSAPASLQVEAGERVALRAGVGGARRGVLEALVGRRAAAAGVVEVGGFDVRELEPHALRDACALVGEIDVMPATLRENVLVGRPGDGAAVRRLLERCGLGDALAALPNGLDTMLDRDGDPLRVGHLGPLMLARALAGTPRALLIDRMLDAMPPAARQVSLALLSGAERDCTIVVATDLDEVAAAMDRSVILGDGSAAPATEAR